MQFLWWSTFFNSTEITQYIENHYKNHFFCIGNCTFTLVRVYISITTISIVFFLNRIKQKLLWYINVVHIRSDRAIAGPFVFFWIANGSKAKHSISFGLLGHKSIANFSRVATNRSSHHEELNSSSESVINGTILSLIRYSIWSTKKCVSLCNRQNQCIFETNLICLLYNILSVI